MLKDPLVTIIVVTYNSEKYVLETLESAKTQIYQNIELIVSDDCSTDNTLEICKIWINNNNGRFFRTKIITNKKNTGTSGNCNRGLKEATGDWIKFIAGDDELLPNCLIDNIQYLVDKPDILILTSFLNAYKNYFTLENYITTIKNNSEFFHPEVTAQMQNKMLLKANPVLAVTSFIRKDIFFVIDGFDEDVKLIEDLPLWLRVTQNGIRIYSFDCITVNYRVRADSVLRGGKLFMTANYAKNLLIFTNKYLKNKKHVICIFLIKFSLYMVIFLNIIGLNRNFFINAKVFGKFVPWIIAFSFRCSICDYKFT
ncbi:MAG: glycosyltransferase [Bacteroidota bacterium]